MTVKERSSVQEASELFNRGEIQPAAKLCAEVLENNPDDVDALQILGLIKMREGKTDIAAQLFSKAIRLAPKKPNAHLNYANLLSKQEKYDQAELGYREAIKLDGKNAAAWNGLGSVLRSRGRFDASGQAIKKALALAPDQAGLYRNLASTFSKAGDQKNALLTLFDALKCDPRSAPTYDAIGVSHYRECNYTEAINWFRKAIEHDPEYARAHLNLGILLLLSGDWENGWEEYAWRYKDPNFPILRFPQPIWTGERIEGKRLFLHSEQGIGDSVQFCRYFSQIKKMSGATVICRLPKAIAGLIGDLQGIDEVVTGKPYPDFDYHCPLLHLPLALKTRPDNIPGEVPYIFPARERVVSWGEFFKDYPGPKVGVVWAGNPKHLNDANRSMAFSTMAKLLDVASINFFSLQVGPRTKELQAFKKKTASGIVVLSDRLKNFTETAAAMLWMDLIISVDTSVVHVAGALGRPVWTLLPFNPDWRWMLAGGETLWYPTMRLIRQDKGEDWDTVMERVRKKLTARF